MDSLIQQHNQQLTRKTGLNARVEIASKAQGTLSPISGHNSRLLGFNPHNGTMKNLFFKLFGPLLAVVGVLGLAGSSILWNFQGRDLGLPCTALSFLILVIGIVLLRPLSSATTTEAIEINKEKRTGVFAESSQSDQLIQQESVDASFF